jgi:hypothetical protein
MTITTARPTTPGHTMPSQVTTTSAEARAFMAAAPTQADAARLTLAQLRALRAWAGDSA